jgi:hypothetical protein
VLAVGDTVTSTDSWSEGALYQIVAIMSDGSLAKIKKVGEGKDLGKSFLTGTYYLELAI